MNGCPIESPQLPSRQLATTKIASVKKLANKKPLVSTKMVETSYVFEKWVETPYVHEKWMEFLQTSMGFFHAFHQL